MALQLRPAALLPPMAHKMWQVLSCVAAATSASLLPSPAAMICSVNRSAATRPYPLPASQELHSSLLLHAPSLLMLHGPWFCTLFMRGIAQMDGSTNLGGPTPAPNPPAQLSEHTPDWPPERSAPPTLLDFSCTAARGVAFCRAAHPA